jgi:hypothetical protein
MDPIILDYPIDFEGGKLTEIQLRRPQVKDVTKSQKGNADAGDAEVKLVATLSGLPPSAIESLDLADYKKVQDVLKGFFG